MKKHQTTGIWILLLILLVVVFASTLIFRDQTTLIKEINQTEFSQLINQGKIKEAKIQGSDILATGKDNKHYKTVMPPVQYASDKLSESMEKHGVQVSYIPAEDSGKWFGLLTSLFIPLGLLALVILVIRSAQAGGSQAMSFGKSRARMMPENKVKVTFNDVAGIDECKQELEEIVDFLKNAEKYQKLGARIPKGVLLVGAPGTGKTLLAKAVAGEAGVAYFSISGSDFVEMFVGVGASRVRDLFDQAKKHSPCIIFMDEIDAVGRQRGAGLGGGHDEREQTLNQLLVEMDGFDSTTGIILLAATNRPDILDNALLRPGRFDRQVVLDRPDIKGRFEILKVHSRNKPLSKNVDLKRLAKSTPGFTGADLENLINEGALLAARNDADEIGMGDLEQAIDKVIVGPEKRSRLISEKEKENTAYHEVGHTLLQILVPGQNRFRKVTIIPRGMALGITWGMPDEDNHCATRNELLASIAMMLGGRVAEQLIFGDYTTGASNDIEKATNLARRLVTVYGMSEALGPIKFGNQNEHVFMGRDFGADRDYSEEIAAKIDSEIKKIIDEQYQLAVKTLTENRDMMEAIVKVLLENETLDDKEVYQIMDDVLVQRGEEPRFMKNQKDEPLPDDDFFTSSSSSASNGNGKADGAPSESPEGAATP
jgi:cell division protease FtsH